MSSGRAHRQHPSIRSPVAVLGVGAHEIGLGIPKGRQAERPWPGPARRRLRQQVGAVRGAGRSSCVQAGGGDRSDGGIRGLANPGVFARATAPAGARSTRSTAAGDAAQRASRAPAPAPGIPDR